MDPRRPHQPPPTDRAFSLIEVALALGIVAFAFTALMGMLPIGLGLFRSATDTSVATRIVQNVAGDLQQADFDTFATADGRTFYYDEQGTVQASAKGAIYWARVSIFASTQLPGSSQSGTADLARIVIQVAHNPAAKEPTAGSDGTWQEQDGVRIIKRFLFLARNTPVAGA